MIRHHNKFVQTNVGRMQWNVNPALPCNRPHRTQKNRISNDTPQSATFLVCAYRHEVIPLGGVVKSLKTNRPSSVCRTTHIFHALDQDLTP
jgi:hypothetical protein